MERFNYDFVFKNGFLEIVEVEQGEDYERRYIEIFTKVAKSENYYEKDLYNFNNYETQQFIYSYKSTDVAGMSLIANLIYRYQLFAYNSLKTSVIPKRLQAKDIRQLLDDFKIFSKFLTYNEYLQLIHNLENAQDQATIVLAWNGILGVGLKDILNLKVEDIDFANNKINYIDEDKKQHHHELHEWEMNIIKDAIHQEKYVSVKVLEEDTKMFFSDDEIKKQLEEKATKREWGDIFSTPYVLRKIGSVKEADMSKNPFTYAGLRTRLRSIQRMTLESAISLKSIQDSGVAYRAIQDKLNYKSTIEVRDYIKENNLYISVVNLKKLVGVILKKIIKEREAN